MLQNLLKLLQHWEEIVNTPEIGEIGQGMEKELSSKISQSLEGYIKMTVNK